MQCAHKSFSDVLPSPRLKRGMKPPYAKKLNSRYGMLWCVFFFKKKRKTKKEKGKTKKKKQWMAVGNGNCKEMRPHCSWLVYWSEALGGPGHFTAITAPTVATTFFFFIFLIFKIFLHFLPFDIYIYIFIYFLHLEDITIPIVPM